MPVRWSENLPTRPVVYTQIGECCHLELPQKLQVTYVKNLLTFHERRSRGVGQFIHMQVWRSRTAPRRSNPGLLDKIKRSRNEGSPPTLKDSNTNDGGLKSQYTWNIMIGSWWIREEVYEFSARQLVQNETIRVLIESLKSGTEATQRGQSLDYQIKIRG